jgi:hypothetical protein
LAKKKIPQIIKEIRKFKPLEVDYRFQKVISFSQFLMFNQCPHKWALQYRDGHYTSESSIHMTFGTAIHSVLQNYLDTLYNISIKAADEINLEEEFEEVLRNQYKIDYEKNKKTHFSSSEQLREFFEDGLGILSWLRRNKGKYFSKRGWYIAGCEIPIVLSPNNAYNNVIYKGFLDVVLYHEPTNKIKIIDIKTSTRGWKDKEKTDEVKNMQLILYKKFFSDQFNFPVDNIDIEYFIVKRKLHGNPDYPDPRVQLHVPASGKIKLGRAISKLNEFITLAFQKDNSYTERELLANPSKFNCTYCPFKNQKSLCNSSIL